MKCRQIRLIQNFLLFLIITSSAIFLSSCNQDRNTSQTTGALALRIAYHGTNNDSQPQASEINCREQGISIIEAKVYDQNNHQLSHDAWGCERHQGTLDVKAGSDRTVVILGKDDNESVLLRGEVSGINVKAETENRMDNPIDCYGFVPKLNNPENGTAAQTDTALIEWDIIAGAKQYRVVVWKDSSLTDLHTKETTTETSYSLSDLAGKTYYWQVVAIDTQGNESAASGIRSNMTFLFSVAAGKDHTLAIKPDGTLWSWGRNQYGQLGLGHGGEGTERSTPNQVGRDKDWASVTAGAYHCAAIKTDGTLWTWGYNANHELGHGPDPRPFFSPTRIGSDKNWAFVAAGANHTLAIKTNGTLWTWGDNKYGQLGLGHIQPEPRPIAIDGSDWAFVAAGAYHTIAIKTNGELWACGKNDYGQLGFAGSGEMYMTNVDSAKDWAFVTAGTYHTAAVKTSGELWSWGKNNNGQLGLDDMINRSQPDRVGTDTDWKYVVATADGYTLAVKTSGELWAWGYNVRGQLGLGDTVQRTAPNMVDTTNWEFVNTRGDHTVAQSIDGKIWCWGKNIFGEVGNGTFSRRRNPTRVNADTDWDKVVTGSPGAYSLVIKTNGELWAWGQNMYGQLGLGNSGSQKNPMRVGEEQDWNHITAGTYHTTAIRQADGDTGGTLWHLGVVDDNVVLEKIGDDDWQYIAAGSYFTMAIKGVGKDRTLWAWGNNKYGQLGLGDDKTRDLPEKVGSDNNWATVSAGGSHVLAIKTDGTLWAWGDNDLGQLGQGIKNADDLHTPTRIGDENNTGWASVTAAYNYSVAIKTDGTLWTWGSNDNGQLGLNHKEDQTIPTQVKGEDNVTWNCAAVGDNHTVAIRNDGTLWAWGFNGKGQLGDETLGTTLAPARIGTGSDWVHVGAGDNHTMAIKEDGTLWTWGDNTYGELGDGSAWQASPVHIPLEQAD